MRNSLTLAMVVAALLFLPSIEAQAQIYKCSNDGRITYQNDPCPTGAPAQRPTVAQLNAERDKHLRQADDAAAHRSQSTDGDAWSHNPAGPSGSSIRTDQEHRTSATTRAASPVTAFNCDGRTYCSQMTSCTEAKLFLAHCPGVKMDGNHDGIPCERQWCSD